MSKLETAERREFGSLRLRGRIWWLRYRVDGKERWESLATSSRREAEKKAAVIEDRVGRGEHIALDARRVAFEDLETMLRTYYQNTGRRSLRRVEGALKHLREAFAGVRALAITADRISEYEAERLEAGAARATVNYELAMLRKAFNLAIRARRLPARPAISTPAPANARTGFFEAEDFACVLEQLPAYLQPVMRFAYLTGWRVSSEVLRLTWDRVDFNAGVVRLEPNTTKNAKGRTFPFDALPELATLLREQRDATSALKRSTGSLILHVFHRRGAPIKSYRKAWHSACRRAATSRTGDLEVIARPHLIGRIPHDFRRSAVRNLVRAGIPERVAMQLTGHKTRAIFDRYDIVNEADLRAGVSKLAAYLSGDRESSAAREQPKGTAGGQSGLKLVEASA